jgi:hypothetical protein
VTRLPLVAFFLEVGLALIVVPWSSWWDRNYFAQLTPAIHAIVTNNFVRGAVSGLGIVNVAAAVAELFALLVNRQGRPAPPSILSGIPPPGPDLGPTRKQEQE